MCSVTCQSNDRGGEEQTQVAGTELLLLFRILRRVTLLRRQIICSWCGNASIAGVATSVSRVEKVSPDTIAWDSGTQKEDSWLPYTTVRAMKSIL